MSSTRPFRVARTINSAPTISLADLERQLEGDYVRDVESLPANVGSIVQNPMPLLSGLASIPGTVAGYLSNRSLPEIAGDVGGFAVDVASGLVSDPMQSLLETFNVPGMAADLGEIRSNAATLRDMGMYEEANQLEQLAAVSLASFAVPGVGNKTRPAVRAGARAAVEAAEAAAPAVSDFAVGRVSDPIRGYHGSPHKFDQFDASKIGTGEGAQAYGHGLYFAENEGVARDYRNRLSDAPIDKVKADLYDIAGDRQWRLSAWNDAGDKVPISNKYLSDNELQYWVGDDAAKNIISGGDGTYKDINYKPGHLYEVNIHADPDSFLDWDKPLSAQSEHVRRALSTDKRASDKYYGNTGEYYRGLTSTHAQNAPMHYSVDQGENWAQQFASKDLGARGIPGIRYLDQGSRAAGEGSRNYVVFDPQTIEILRRYREGGGVGSSDFAVRPQSDIGAQIDTTRPILDNPDGSFSTERTITIEADGKYFNIPTIVGGRQQSQEDAIRLWRSGNNNEVGVFNTLEDALSTAQRRSSEIGRVRGGSR